VITPKSICKQCFKKTLPESKWNRADNDLWIKACKHNTGWGCTHVSHGEIQSYPPPQCPWAAELVLLKQDHGAPTYTFKANLVIRGATRAFGDLKEATTKVSKQLKTFGGVIKEQESRDA